MWHYGRIDTELNETVTNYGKAEDEDNEMPDVGNNRGTTDDIELQDVTSTEKENLLKQMVEDEFFH